MDMEKWMDKFIEYGTEYGLKVIGAILIWIIGSWIIRRIRKLVNRAMTRVDYDVSLQKFLSSLIYWALKILLVIAILSNLGIETTSFAAILAAAGLAIGLALQGSLSNFAGGVLILIFKPFKVGDFIGAQGESGTVKVIDIFTTQILTPNNILVILPNGALSNGNITNYTAEPSRRFILTIGVSYDADLKLTRKVLNDVLAANELVLSDPAPMVEVSELANSSVNFTVRGSVKMDRYWDAYFDTVESIKEALDANGIEIPYPHMVQINRVGAPAV